MDCFTFSLLHQLPFPTYNTYSELFVFIAVHINLQCIECACYNLGDSFSWKYDDEQNEEKN